ncbi:MAG: glycoside hydrolase family 2, partial [Clostridia bacterium]|nr:glycoside hydrolase family 2 [Clostridia bacterium]
MEYTNLVTSEAMVFDRSRKKEPLNGPWNYGIDQYDHFLEGNWQNEKMTDRNGLSLPLDYSFDEWPLMNLPVCWN